MTSPADRLARQQDREQGIGTNKKAVKFSQQDYETLREQCLKSGRLFEDNCFPAEPTSLGYKKLGPHSPKTKGVVWKRPKELCSNPKFIDDGATRMDICQGELGDCWLLAAIASLTLDQEILARVVPQEQSFTEGYAGIFHFQFWQFGEWVDVVIDDRLPTRDGKLLFVHSAEGSEFWSALLEKAYAKLYGSYEALIEGNTTEGFEDFTGGIAEIYTLEETPPKLFQIMQKALSLGSLLGCSIKTTSANEVEKRTALNLFKGHAYSVTGAEEVHFQGKPVQLVRMRNPWGYKEWTGPWSDKSIEWNHLSQDEKSKLNHVADDGEFWMSYSDFIKQFSRLEICNLTPDSLMSDEVGHWNHYQFEGTWREGSTAGGCRNYPDTFSSNPQFVVRLEDVDDDPLDGKDGCTFLVGLMQKGGRQQKLGFNPEFIGFAIYKYKGQSNVHLGPDALQSCVAESSFANTREVCNRFKLPPGEYAIVPSTFQPDKNGSFLLRVFSEKQAAARYCVTVTYRLIDDMEVSAFELVEILNKICEQSIKFIIQDELFINLNIPQKDESSKLGLMEFNLLWSKIQKYLAIFNKHDTDSSGTMNSHEMRGAATEAGFQVNSAVLQSIVSRYSDAQYVIDFDSFVGCLIKLEMLFKMFKTLERADTGKIELDMQQVCKTITKAAGLSGLLV
uniref:Calpain 8 n=1 Tax=Sander lucioperca TaxID=283035 RepID=A0A8C9ZK71_SANLU